MGPGRATPGHRGTQHVLIADDSALPAVETILGALPASAHARVLEGSVRKKSASIDQSAALDVTGCRAAPITAMPPAAGKIVARRSGDRGRHRIYWLRSRRHAPNSPDADQ